VTSAAQCDETAGSCRNPLLIAMSGVAVAGMPEPIWNKETRMSDCGSQAYCHRHVAVCDLNRGCAVPKELEEKREAICSVKASGEQHQAEIPAQYWRPNPHMPRTIDDGTLLSQITGLYNAATELRPGIA
jgi:hypothetical protein